jgi:hypothetical protein
VLESVAKVCIHWSCLSCAAARGLPEEEKMKQVSIFEKSLPFYDGEIKT